MGQVFMKLRIMPTGVDVNLDEILEKIKAIDLKDVEIKDSKTQPIAFGLKALLIVAVMPDEEGISDKFVEEIQKIENVESVEIESMELV